MCVYVWIPTVKIYWYFVNPKVRELSEEEKQMIILSEDFQRFIDRTSRIVERALGESVDIYTDYTGTMDGEDGMWVKISIK